MRKLTSAFFAVVMMLSVVFISGAISDSNPFAAEAQTRRSQVRVKRQRKGAIRTTYAGGRYVVRRTWDGTKWVSNKVWQGTKYTGRKTVQGTRYAAHKTKRGTKATISRTKKIVY